MKYISAGHCNTPGPTYDPGAFGINGRYEAKETVILRDAVINELRRRGITDIIQDLNEENRHQYFRRAKTGNGSVVIEFHFNAGPSHASGSEALVGVDCSKLDKEMATQFATTTSSILGIPNRGVKSEATTRHKRLGLMRERGIVTLVETCFISNQADMEAYDKNFRQLVAGYCDIIIYYDSLIN